MRASVVDLSATRAAFRYVSCLRLPEIAVLQGSPLLGAAFAIPRPGMEYVEPIAILTVANLCLVAHIFMLNDWAGLSTDLSDPNKAASVFTTRGVETREVGSLTVILLAVSLFLFSRLGAVTLGVALAIAGLSALYSLPGFDWKGRPILNSIAHLAGGILHFLLGYCVVSAIDHRALAIATFFSLTFAAGHLTQEIRDYQGDVLNAIRTNAVIFGKRCTFAASAALFTLAYAVLLLLAVQRVIPRALAVLVVLYPVHVRWSLEALRDGLTYAGIRRLQTRYRLLFAMLAAAMLAALFISGSP
jgi:4-hydroxybenzoate polyprenyltransferase